jgi:hypothetical protein
MNRERAKKLSIWSIQQNPQQVSNAGAYEVIIKRRVETPVTWFDVYQQAALFTVRSTRIFGTQMEWNGRQSHDCSELFWLPRFSSWGSQNRTEQNRTEQNRTEQNRTEQNRTEQNRTEHVRRRIVCVQCTLHRVLFWRINRYIYTYSMLFER